MTKRHWWSADIYGLSTAAQCQVYLRESTYNIRLSQPLSPLCLRFSGSIVGFPTVVLQQSDDCVAEPTLRSLRHSLHVHHHRILADVLWTRKGPSQRLISIFVRWAHWFKDQVGQYLLFLDSHSHSYQLSNQPKHICWLDDSTMVTSCKWSW